MFGDVELSYLGENRISDGYPKTISDWLSNCLENHDACHMEHSSQSNRLPT